MVTSQTGANFNSTKVQFGDVTTDPSNLAKIISIPLRYNLEP